MWYNKQIKRRKCYLKVWNKKLLQLKDFQKNSLPQMLMKTGTMCNQVYLHKRYLILNNNAYKIIFIT